MQLDSHLQFLLHFHTKQQRKKNFYFFLKTVFQTRFHWTDRIEQSIMFETRLEDEATKFLTV